MNLTEFCEFVKETFEQELTQFQTALDEDAGILEVYDRVTGERQPSINLSDLFFMTKDKVAPDEAAGNIIKAYRLKLAEEQKVQPRKHNPDPENSVFLAFNKLQSSGYMENSIFLDKGDVILVFGNISDQGEFHPLTNDGTINIDELYRQSVMNMRRDFPCKCIPLSEYMKEHSGNQTLSPASAKDIYVLYCENKDFTYGSTGLYYSAKEIKELSEQTGREYYVFRCTGSLTLLSPCAEFTREEAAQLMQDFHEESMEMFCSEPLVYSNGELSRLSEPRAHRIAKSL